MICYVLDEHLQPDQYHTMISHKLVDQALVSEPFVKNLVDNGKLLYVTRFAKRYHIPHFIVWRKTALKFTSKFSV